MIPIIFVVLQDLAWGYDEPDIVVARVFSSKQKAKDYIAWKNRATGLSIYAFKIEEHLLDLSFND